MKKQYEEMKQIYEWQKASSYIDGFCHGYIICSVLAFLIGVCVYLM